MNTTIQIRVDKKTKKAADQTLKELGLDLSAGIKLFLRQVVRTQAIPFPLFTADNFSEAKKQRLVRESNYALKHGKSYRSAEELFEDVMKDED